MEVTSVVKRTPFSELSNDYREIKRNEKLKEVPTIKVLKTNSGYEVV